jgi:hypothetical protein
MRIFEMRPEIEHYRWLTMAHESDFNALADLGVTGGGGRWTPPPAEWIDDDLNAGKPRSDYPPLGTTPAFSQRAVDRLRDVLEENGELLPLALKGEPYYVYNVTRSIDALDEDRSDLVRFSSGRIMEVRRLELRPDELCGVSIFRLPQVRGQIYARESFMKRVADSGLTGFAFREVWDG